MGAVGLASEAPKYEWGKERLLAADFDETMAVTSEPAPNGMTVESACHQAVYRVLGADACSRYVDLGGLRNRAPSEVVAELLPPTTSGTRLKDRTEDFIAAKLEVLTSQIGTQLPDGELWPRPTAGFRHLWETASGFDSITTGVTSSGHQPFIERFCEVQEVSVPDIFVTDDDMRPLLDLLPRTMCAKPNRLIIDLLQQRWLEHLGYAADHANVQLSRAHILGAGDDGNSKDSNLAEAAGIQFVKIDPDCPSVGWQQVGQLLIAQSYRSAASA